MPVLYSQSPLAQNLNLKTLAEPGEIEREEEERGSNADDGNGGGRRALWGKLALHIQNIRNPKRVRTRGKQRRPGELMVVTGRE